MNRCDVGSDGKTPLQRLHGRRDNVPILEFGEKILYMPARVSERRKVGAAVPFWSVRWKSSIRRQRQWLSPSKERSRSRHARPASEESPESERWDADGILRVRALPWSPDGSDDAFDHPSWNGDSRGDGASPPRRRADGERGGEGRTFAERTSSSGVTARAVPGADT